MNDENKCFILSANDNREFGHFRVAGIYSSQEKADNASEQLKKYFKVCGGIWTHIEVFTLDAPPCTKEFYKR